MKITLGEGRGMVEGLQAIMARKLPVKISYWFARTLREIGGHMEDFEKARMSLVERHVKKDKKGNKIQLKNVFIMKDQEAFDKEFKELADQEISIKFDGVTLEQIGENQTCPHCKKELPEAVIEGSVLFNLGKLIKEPTDGDESKKEEKA